MITAKVKAMKRYQSRSDYEALLSIAIIDKKKENMKRMAQESDTP